MPFHDQAVQIPQQNGLFRSRRHSSGELRQMRVARDLHDHLPHDLRIDIQAAKIKQFVLKRVRRRDYRED